MSVLYSLSFFIHVLLLGIPLAAGKGKDGISCYLCSSMESPACGKPFDSSKFKMINCKDTAVSDTPGVNATACVTWESTGNSKKVIHRLCGAPETNKSSKSDRCSKITRSVEGVPTTFNKCSCDTDGCNSAPRQIRSSLGFATQLGLHIIVLITTFYYGFYFI